MRACIVTALLIAFAVRAVAEDETPLTEVSLQYQMVRVNSSRSLPSFTANGGTSNFQIKFIDHLAAVAEIGAEHNGNIHDIQLDNTWLTYLFGPRFSVTKRSSRIVPSIQCLLGGVDVAGSIKSPLLPAIPGARIHGGRSAFAIAVGGTLDIRLNHHFTLRPIEAGYLLTRLQSKTLLDGISARTTSAMAPGLCSALAVRSGLDDSFAYAAWRSFSH